MTGTELVTDIRSELLEPVPGFWSNDELLLWINRAESDYVNRIRGLEATAFLSTVAGTNVYALPATVLSVVAIFYNDEQNGVDSWRPLEPTDLQRLSRERPNEFLSTETDKRGTPAQVARWNNSLYLIPTPIAAGTDNVKLFVKTKPTPLTTLADSLNVDDTLSGAIKSFVLWKAWTKEKEFEFAADQKAIYDGFVRDGLRWVKLQMLNKVHQIDVQSGTPYSGGWNV